MLNVDINGSTYVELKRSVSGFYQKFNTQVLRFYMYKIFNYDLLISSVDRFDTFEDYYDFHTRYRQDLIEESLEKMYDEALRKGLNPTRESVETCLIVRLGNIYHGIYVENKIISTTQQLADWLVCEKAERQIDLDYKIDAFISIPAINVIGIQIKPISFLSYAKGSEDESHKKFYDKTGTKVYYCFYKDEDTIVLDGTEIKLYNRELYIEKLTELLCY